MGDPCQCLLDGSGLGGTGRTEGAGRGTGFVMSSSWVGLPSQVQGAAADQHGIRCQVTELSLSQVLLQVRAQAAGNVWECSQGFIRLAQASSDSGGLRVGLKLGPTPQCRPRLSLSQPPPLLHSLLQTSYSRSVGQGKRAGSSGQST